MIKSAIAKKRGPKSLADKIKSIEHSGDKVMRSKYQKLISKDGIDGWLVVYDIPVQRRKRFYRNLRDLRVFIDGTMSEKFFYDYNTASNVYELAKACGGEANIYAVKKVNNH